VYLRFGNFCTQIFYLSTFRRCILLADIHAYILVNKMTDSQKVARASTFLRVLVLSLVDNFALSSLARIVVESSFNYVSRRKLKLSKQTNTIHRRAHDLLELPYVFLNLTLAPMRSLLYRRGPRLVCKYDCGGLSNI
jgi:hypothetical protein